MQILHWNPTQRCKNASLPPQTVMELTSSRSKALTPATTTSPSLADSEIDPKRWSVTNTGGLSFTSVTIKMTVVCPGLVPFAAEVTGSISLAYNTNHI